MDLIERYIHDVSRRLPKRMRDDVSAELRSSLGEAFDATVAEFNRDAGRMAGEDDRETLAADLVKKFGPPAALAASYRPGPQWLIGPDLYPAFLRTLKVVSAIIVGIFVLAIVIDALKDDLVLIEAMLRLSTSHLLGDLVAAMGWVVLVFWIIQLVTWKRQGGEASGGIDVFATAYYCGPDADSWDPRELPQVDDPDRIGRTGLMIEIAIMIGLVALFAAFPQAIGGSVAVNGERGWIALMGPGVLENRQLLYVGFIGIVVLNLMLLRHNRWSIPTRVIDLVLNVVFIVALAQMIVAGEVVAVQAEDLIANGWSLASVENLTVKVFPVMDTIVRWILGFVIVGIVWSSIEKTVKLVRRLS